MKNQFIKINRLIVIWGHPESMYALRGREGVSLKAYESVLGGGGWSSRIVRTLFEKNYYRIIWMIPMRVTDAVGAPRKIFGGGPPDSFFEYILIFWLEKFTDHRHIMSNLYDSFLKAQTKGLWLPNREYGVKVTRYGGVEKIRVNSDNTRSISGPSQGF